MKNIDCAFPFRALAVALALSCCTAVAAAAANIPLTLKVPVQLQNIPSDLTSVSVLCFVTSPGRQLGNNSTPVPIRNGSYNGTITVVVNVPELPYDASYACRLNQANSSLDTLEQMRGWKVDPAIPKVLTNSGSVH